MIAVSNAWKDIQARLLLPETHIEIDCSVTEVDVQNGIEIFGTDEAVFSNTISAKYEDIEAIKYATNELNLWALDGSFSIAPDSGPYANIGYTSDIDSNGSITVKLKELHSSITSGVTITWGGRHDEYPSSFTITAKNGNEVVYHYKVVDNTDQVSEIFSKIQNYDSITITVNEWCLPYRRVRIEKFIIGNMLTFNKGDIFSYTHEQTGHLNSGELPKNSISFTLNNTDGRWDPGNPIGMEQYLSERQRLKVRYGLDVNGTIEWIKAGTFYLSEWRIPSNGLEASFVARDVFEYLLNETYPTNGNRSGTLNELISEAFESAGVPDDVTKLVDESLQKYSATIPDGEYTCAEIVQMCANAAGCVVYQDREGELHIEPLNKVHSGVNIPLTLSYSHPEIELSKPLRSVSVSYVNGGPYVFQVGNSGETQTVSNPLVVDETQAQLVAEWVKDTLVTRKTVKGEYRADPRLDVFDIVAVASKYGDLQNVALTSIKYTFNGSFRGEYTGRLLEVINT